MDLDDYSAMELVDSCLDEVSKLSFDTIKNLPSALDFPHKPEFGGIHLTRFVQLVDHDRLLVTCQLSKATYFGMMSSAIERGVIISRDGICRPATDEELQATGG